MKKLVVILILICTCFSAFAALTYLDNLSKGVQVYGYIDQYCLIYITPIQAQSGDTAGFPFSIEGSDIVHRPSDLRTGRQIGTWSFATNMSAITLRFNATPLVSEDDPEYKLNYYLTFKYEYAEELSGTTNSSVLDYITLHSGTTTEVTLTNHNEESEVPIISMGNDIRFQLDGTYDFSDYPVGFYYSDITIVLEGV